MKKALLTLALAMMALVAGTQAQENNVKWVVGGTGSFSHDYDKIVKNDNSESTLIHMEPFVGNQLNDRCARGPHLRLRLLGM